MRHSTEFARFYIEFEKLKCFYLTPLDKLVYGYFKNYLCPYGILSSNRQLADRYGVSLSQIKRSIKKLKKHDLIYIKGNTSHRRIFCF